MPQLLDLITPFFIAATSTAVSLMIVKLKHKGLSLKQILIFWLVVSVVFLVMSLIPQPIAEFPFMYFILQAILVIVLTTYLWKLKREKVFLFTIVYTFVNLGVILSIGYLLKNVV